MIKRKEIMTMLILIYFLSLVPSALIFFWLRRRKADDREYRIICDRALKRGAFLCAVLVSLIACILYLLGKVMSMLGAGPLIIEIYNNLILAALVEELVKYRVLKGLIRKNPYPYSWADITSLMMITGMGFGVLESLFYALGANAGTMLTRGLTAMHCGYGFIMGYFVGKGMKTGKKRYTLMGILIPFLLHGAYDCCLGDELGKVSGYFIYVSLVLAAAAVVTLIIAIVHICRSKRKAVYTEPLVSE